MAKKKTPTDINQLAKFIVDQTTEDRPVEEPPPQPQAREKNPAAVALGRLGGLKGGKVRAQRLTSERKKEIAKNAADKRWRNENE